MKNSRWGSTELFRESVLNIASSGARTQGFVAVAVLLGIGFVMFSAIEGDEFRREIASESTGGAYVLQFVAADNKHPVSIDRASCENLTIDHRVERSGLMLNPRSTSLPQMGARVRVIDASSSLFSELRTFDLAVGSSLQFSGVHLSVGNGAVLAAHLVPQPVGLDVNSSIVYPLDPRVRSSDLCIAVLHDLVDVKAAAVDLSSEVIASGGPLRTGLSPLDPAGATVRYLDRPSRYLALLLGLVAGILAAITNLFRSSEFSVYRLSGTTVGELARIVSFEQAVMAGCFAASTAVTSLALSSHLLSARSTILFGIAGGSLWVLSASLLSTFVVRANPITLSRDR